MSPKAISDKATLPDFPLVLFSRADRPHSPYFHSAEFLLFFCVLQHAQDLSACSVYSMD